MNIKEHLGESWYRKLKRETKKDYFRELRRILIRERRKYSILPSGRDTFRAFRETPFEDVRVVILGQDPYFIKGMAHGLAFSTNGKKVPVSLRNIFRELEEDLGFNSVTYNPDLTRWARQGVLLLNTCLTVREGTPGSHSRIGWQKLTRKALEILNEEKSGLVFILWGQHARSFAPFINRKRHLVIESAHPVARGAHLGFFGSKPFSKTNEYLGSSAELFGPTTLINWFANE